MTRSLAKTPSPWILPVIIASQFAGTSLWFAGNAVLPDLQASGSIPPGSLGYVTSAVQFGFICGTLIFAFLSLSDRFSPRILFFCCALLGAAANLMVYLTPVGLGSLLFFRFMTGLFLAGIYPVGMKIAAGWYQQGLGNALGFLVGALVLGTAFPHLLKAMGPVAPWQQVIVATSAASALGGLLMLALVPDGPHHAKSNGFDSRALIVIFEARAFRAASFGYFGHMWELYTFWAFVPFFLQAYATFHAETAVNIPFWSFAIIAAGFVGCVGGGLLSRKIGSAPVAFAQLTVSGMCCLLSPLAFLAPLPAFLVFLLLWGVVVVGDSPQFSALTARTAPKHLVGSALTIVNCIGFSITIASIQATSYLSGKIDARFIFLVLVVGPVLGLAALRPLLGSARTSETKGVQ
jgi:MFS family permease